AGAVRIENAEGVAVTDSVFRQMGGNGVFFYGYNDGHRIANCDFLDLGATAVQVVGKPDAVYDPSFWPHDLYPGHQVHKTTVTQPDKVGPKTEDYPRDIVIENNHMENMGIFEKQSCGVNMSVSSRIKVLHNTIHKSARSGINVNDGTFGGHEIAYNDVYDCQRETQDHGQFNSWGRDRFWSVPSYNASGQNGDKLRHYVVNGVEYDVTRIDAYQTTSIHNNRFHHDTARGSTWGIDLDDGSSGYEIYNNLCLGMGIKLREGFDRKVYNNIILDGQFQIHVSYTEANDEIYGNLVLNSTPFGFAAVDENRFKAAGYDVDRNWYYNFDRGVNLPGWFAANRVGSPYDANAMIGVDPDFFNPYGNDYTVGNTAAMAQVGFENFPMDDFGKRDCACHAPVYAKVSASSGSSDVLQREVWKDATISGIDDAIISSTASSGYNGVYFEDVPADSEAYALGLRTRDIVKAVNGVTLGYKGTFHRQFEIIPPNGLVILDIHRANAMQTVSFVKIQGETSTVLWNDPSVRYNGGGANWGTNVNASDHTSLGVHYSTESQPWVEVDFTGSQIAFLSRKYSDQGDCRVTVTDRATGATVVEQTASCYDTQRQYGVAAYTSPVLPQGNYTLRVQKTSGQYLILDCFIVTAFDDSPDHNLLAGPTALTWDSGAPATALRPGETLHIAAPLRNAGEKDLEITAVMGLWDVAGGNQPQTLNTASLILPAGQETVFEESVTLPDDAAGKAVRVLYLADGRPVAYPTTLTGGDFEMPAATPVENAPAGKLEAAFDPATRRLTLTAAGLAANAQAVLTAADGDTLLLADQVKATDGAAAFAVGAPASWSGRTITFTVTDEFGAAVSADVSLPEPSFLPGDVDGDGDVDAADALLALQAATGKIRLDEQRQKAADVDGVPGVTAADALLILQKSTGKIGAFPCEK
ncbi:MAG: right-handed parallel beta-helix repeat-containing protein, partial [Acutalibacteraceae bacterium]